MADRIKNYQQEADQITTLKEIRTDLGVTPSSYTPDATVVTKDRVVTFAQAEEELVVLGDIERGVCNLIGDVNKNENDIANIKALLQGHLYDYQTDSTSGYTKTVPSGAMPYAGLEQIGGKTVVWNQLVQNGNFADGTNGWTKSATNMAISATDGTLLATIVSTVSNTVTVNTDVNIIAGHKYLIKGNISRKHTGTSITWNSFLVKFDDATVATISTPSADIGVVKAIDQIVTATDNASKLNLGYGYVPSASVSDVFTLNNIELFDLTQMFGSGSEPSTVEEFDEIFPVAYYVYSTPVLMSAGVTSVVSKDSSDNTLQTYFIPASVQALTGYGWSCPSHYNYIDFEAKKYVQEVGSRAYTSGDESDSTVITDGTTTYYPLNPAIETDISAYITEDNLIQVEAGGTLKFQNQHGDDYRLPVPSEETYMIDLQEAINNG